MNRGSPSRLRRSRWKCICCRRPLDMEGAERRGAIASGPVCYPCYWAAKLVHESAIKTVEAIPDALKPSLAQLFRNGGYSWPTDLVRALEARHFDKADTVMRRWWNPD